MVSVSHQVNAHVVVDILATAVSWISTNARVICTDVITRQRASICLDGIIAGANLVTVVLFTIAPKGHTV